MSAGMLNINPVLFFNNSNRKAPDSGLAPTGDSAIHRRCHRL